MKMPSEVKVDSSGRPPSTVSSLLPSLIEILTSP
jgi:hypothetical protein